MPALCSPCRELPTRRKRSCTAIRSSPRSRRPSTSFARSCRARGLGIDAEGRLIGAVRWTVHDDTAHIGRLVVAPDLQGQGIDTVLLRSAEHASGATQFELFTGHLSAANIRLYEREGYARTRQVPLQPGVELVYLSKVIRGI